jgi:DnaJ family protein C protein 17
MTSTFGPVDKDGIVLSIKPPKKAEHKPPKYATAAVRFGKIADAHAAVCASGRADRGLDHFDIKWVGGTEPAVWSWSERMLKLKEVRKASGEEKDGVRGVPTSSLPGTGGGLSQAGGQSAVESKFASFPSSFARILYSSLFLQIPLTFCYSLHSHSLTFLSSRPHPFLASTSNQRC